MKGTMEDFFDTLDKSNKLDPWVNKKTLDDYKKELVSEAEELAEALESKDYENLKEEVGDLIWDVFTFASIAEIRGHFTVKEAIESVTEKIKRRKPYLADGRKVTAEEARRIWLEVKAREKNTKNES